MVGANLCEQLKSETAEEKVKNKKLYLMSQADKRYIYLYISICIFRLLSSSLLILHNVHFVIIIFFFLELASIFNSFFL